MKHRKMTAILAAMLCVSTLFTGCTAANQTTGNSDEVAKLQAQVDLLQNYIEVNMRADLENWDGSYVGNGDANIHSIYDDTAVVEAYRTGDDSALSEEDKFTLTEAKKVIESVITDGMTDYEKEKAIYDWQVAYVAYDTTQQAAIPPTINLSEYNYYPYGVFKYHTAICVGNATTFKLFMDMLDIECKIIHSTNSGEHAWNLVHIGDGWYHVDVTFDGGNKDCRFYTYFNVPDTAKLNGTYGWDASEFPAADATEYCFAEMNKVVLDDLYALPAEIRKCMDNGQRFMFVQLPGGTDLDYSLLDMISGYCPGYYIYSYVTYSMDVDKQIFGINMSKEQINTDPVEAPFDYEKMQQTVSDAFSDFTPAV